MQQQTNVIEYKCPCCNAGLRFGQDTQKLTCEYCENTFDLDTVRAFHESTIKSDTSDFCWADTKQQPLEEDGIRSFVCPSCGGEILTDITTAATFCPFCENPTIMPARLSGLLKPDGVIPFKTGKDDAKAAFLQLCKGKPLLPKMFTQQQRLEKITGIYVPFWLYDCTGNFDGSYQATRIHTWSDSMYRYTKTDHFLLNRSAEAGFAGIPMDGSTKMDDTFMESIEPFDYAALTDFDMAYLSGFLADKYDVPSESGEERIRQRVDNAMDELLQSTFAGYATVVPSSKKLHVNHSKARYVLLPVWLLNTRYRDKLYTFAMNGQTGKMTGSLPVCPVRTAAWFAGLTAVCSALAYLVILLAG